MGGSEHLKRGRFAVAVAAVMLYSLLFVWAPVSFAALALDQSQQTIVSVAFDDADEVFLDCGADPAHSKC